MKKLGLVFAVIITVLSSLSFSDFLAQASILDFFYKNKDTLVVSGNKVLFNNKEILLSGVAVGDPHSREIDYKRSTKDYDIIKNEWGANAVRLSVHPGVYKKNEKQVKKILEDEVAAARKDGLFVIIDWHVVGMPNGWYKEWKWNDSHGYSYDSNFNTAREFWQYVAVQYRGDSGVLFELWNEPADEISPRKWDDLKDYLQRLNDIIRGQGAQNIIIASGMRWSYDLRDIKNSALKGDNIGYAWHSYPGNRYFLSWDKVLDGLNKHYPIFVTEWGFTTNPDGNKHHYTPINDYPEKFSHYLLDNNLNFTAWCWHNPWDPRMFERDWKTLTEYGQFVKTFLNNIKSGVARASKGEAGEIKIAEVNIQDRVLDFIKYGVDINTIKLGEGERKAVVFSYQKAFNRYPVKDNEIEDIIKIANGRWPSATSREAEEQARGYFKTIYKRDVDYGNKNDMSAIMIMSYGLRQRAENRNLESEKKGIVIFKNIFGHNPSSTEEWNIMQAITYSGAKR